jgi:hypothetical protein
MLLVSILDVKNITGVQQQRRSSNNNKQKTTNTQFNKLFRAPNGHINID